MAPTGKANYKSFDAQARLLRAIVAAHSDVKWNYKGKSYAAFPLCLSQGRAVQDAKIDLVVF